MTEKAHTQDGVENPTLGAREALAGKTAPPAIKPESGRGRWKPGQSGNPTGRPKTAAEANKLIRNLTVPAVRRLWKLANSKDPRVAVTALKIIIDRGLGRLPMTITGPGGAPLMGPSLTVNLGQPISDPIAASQAYMRIIGGEEPIDLASVRFAPPEPTPRPALPVGPVIDAEMAGEAPSAPEASPAVLTRTDGGTP